MESEVIYRLSAFKNGKAPEEDNIHADMLRLINTGKLCLTRFITLAAFQRIG